MSLPLDPVQFAMLSDTGFFGVSSADSLPTLSAVQIEDFKAEAEAEMQVDVTV